MSRTVAHIDAGVFNVSGMTSRFVRRLASVPIVALALYTSGCGDPPTYAKVRPEENRPSFAVRAVSPLVGLTPPPVGEAFFDGTVIERLDVGPYAYLAVVDTDSIARWAVTLALEAPSVGDDVHVKSFGMKEQFVSPHLGRTFDRLHFATVSKVKADARLANRETDSNRSSK
jgi:hypothetical protein